MDKTGSNKTRRPARTIEQRQNELINAAYALAERQILEGKASSQVITHFLKLGSIREGLELEKIKKENSLLEAKVESLRDVEKLEKLYSEALKAMSSYQGTQVYDEE